MANATPYLAKLVLDHLSGFATWTPPEDLYLALYTNIGATAEVAGGSYQRQIVQLPEVTPGERQTLTTADVTFPAMPICNVFAVAVCDSLVSGNQLLVQALSGSAVAVAAGDAVIFATGQLVVRGN